jgi:hypothetical protein
MYNTKLFYLFCLVSAMSSQALAEAIFKLSSSIQHELLIYLSACQNLAELKRAVKQKAPLSL